VKAVVCDERWRARAARRGLSDATPAVPDRAEQDPRAWEAALRPAIAGARRGGRGPEAIAALAITGQLDGCVAVDETRRRCTGADLAGPARGGRGGGESMRGGCFAITGQVADASTWRPRSRGSGARGRRGAFHSR